MKRKTTSTWAGFALAGSLAAIAFLSLRQASASGSPLEFKFTKPSQTILNPDGGPWDAANLAQTSVTKLSHLVLSFPTINFSVGPLRLVHTPICLNPVGSDFSGCGNVKTGASNTPASITSEDVKKIDTYLQKAEDANLKIILRFAYNELPRGPDATMDVIVADIAKLAPIVAKHRNIIYAMDAGFIGAFGEGHNSNCGPNCTNDTPDKMRTFMTTEEAAFGPYVTLLNRLPSNILDWEPKGRVIWGIHDDDYSGDTTDSHTWMSPTWSRFGYSFNTLQHFAQGRTDQKPLSVEVSDKSPALDTFDVFDEYSRRFHLNAMGINFQVDNLVKDGHFPEIVNSVGPAIGLTQAVLDLPPGRGLSSKLTLSFQNDGYSRLYVKVPVYLVLTDSSGNRLSEDIFSPVPVPIDLTEIEGSGGSKSASSEITFPIDLASGTRYYVALWMPDPDRTLRGKPQYNYLLNNAGMSTGSTRLNRLFPIQF